MRLRCAVERRDSWTVRDFDKNDAKAWWPVSALLVAVIYTGSKSLVSAQDQKLAEADDPAISVYSGVHVRVVMSPRTH